MKLTSEQKKDIADQQEQENNQQSEAGDTSDDLSLDQFKSKLEEIKKILE